MFYELVVVVADEINAQVERSTTAVERAGFNQKTATKNPGLRQKKNYWQVLNMWPTFMVKMMCRGILVSGLRLNWIIFLPL